MIWYCRDRSTGDAEDCKERPSSVTYIPTCYRACQQHSSASDRNVTAGLTGHDPLPQVGFLVRHWSHEGHDQQPDVAQLSVGNVFFMRLPPVLVARRLAGGCSAGWRTSGYCFSALSAAVLGASPPTRLLSDPSLFLFRCGGLGNPPGGN